MLAFRWRVAKPFLSTYVILFRFVSFSKTSQNNRKQAFLREKQGEFDRITKEGNASSNLAIPTIFPNK
tara:strand:- start:2090 stop:2293 length:204 start_codon:yes stop_codon:yes gene_type:complete